MIWCNPLSGLVEVQSPQAKPWLIRLEVFQIGVRPGPARWTVCDEILAVLPELVDERGVFRLGDLIARLNPDNDVRRRWAVEKALWRLTHASSPTDKNLMHLGSGHYRFMESAESVVGDIPKDSYSPFHST